MQSISFGNSGRGFVVSSGRGISMSESAAQKLLKKSDAKMAGQEYPEHVDRL